MDKVVIGDVIRDVDDGCLFIIVEVNDICIPDLLLIHPISDGSIKHWATMDSFELITK
tara:strand:- start:242 stop:415 length:174 start_codon:yes stop_codon:yes gene_type:complete